MTDFATGGFKKGEVYVGGARTGGKSWFSLIMALRSLIQMIKEGVEYPDAQFRASQRYGVNADELQKLYDEYCLERERRK
jgi:hypothetical protein